jgi:hypothetical protein
MSVMHFLNFIRAFDVGIRELFQLSIPELT